LFAALACRYFLRNELPRERPPTSPGPQAADEEGEVLLDASRELAILTAAIADGASRVLEEHGEAGYRKTWVEHVFPLKSLDRLRDL
jgi:hypothetical protein